MTEQSTVHDKSYELVLFERMLVVVWIFILCYSLFYFYFSAQFAAISLSVGVFILTPLNKFIQKKVNINLAKHLFIFSCNYYIFSTSLGLRHEVAAEYYCIPAAMLALLLFGHTDYKNITIGVLLAVLNWFAIHFTTWRMIDSELTINFSNPEILSTVNFFGSLIISLLFVSIFIITNRKQQAQLAQSYKMASLGEMASGIAHEINNPVSIISGKIRLLTQSINQNNFSKEQVLSELEKINQTASRITKIVKGMRSYSRHVLDDPMTDVSMASLIDNVLTLSGERLKNNQIQIDVLLPAQEVIVHCHETQIMQVVLNLLGNSYDAIINLAEKWIKVELQKNENFIELSVTDSGLGIPEEVAKKIMQPFFTTKEVGQGTGLGLSISKGIIESHRGQFWYDSESRNTRFVIRLPLK